MTQATSSTSAKAAGKSNIYTEGSGGNGPGSGPFPPGSRKRLLRFNSSRMPESRFAYLLVLPVLIFLTAIMVYPTAYSIWISAFQVDLSTDTWQWSGLGNYTQALADPEVRGAILTTIRYTLYVTVLTITLAVFGALLLNERFSGRGWLAGVAILPWSISTYAAGVTFRYLYLPSGFINSVLEHLHLAAQPIQFISADLVLLSIAVAHTWQLGPLGMLFIYASLQVIPEDLYRLARTDGMTRLGRFSHVTWPYIKLPIAIFAVLVTGEAAKAFDIIYFMSGGGPGTASLDLVYEIYKQTFINFQLGYGAAMSYILVVIVIVISTVYFLLISRRRRGEVA